MNDCIPEAAQKIIHDYFNLPLDGKKVPCPYYLNFKKLRMGLRVLVGKGTPEEIIQESLIYEKLRRINFSQMTIEEIRDFLVKRHIGIDCSGFITHILDFWLRSQGKKHLWKYLHFPKQNFYQVITRKLRPVENISAYLLTNDLNSSQIKDLYNIRCGDLIRLKGLKQGFHVMMISQIEKANGKIDSFQYIQASRWYNKEHGARVGKVIIKDHLKPLVFQKWLDEQEGHNWTFEEICKDKDYSQIRRLKYVPLY
jgi:hypothetical protein